jgi:biotin operon repressor
MSRFAKTQHELAARLGVTRQTIAHCLKNFRDKSPPVPTTCADGRYDIPAWQDFMVAHNIAGKADSTPSEKLPGDLRSVADWRIEKVRLECVRLKQAADRESGEVVPISELQSLLGVMLSAFRIAINNIPGRAAPKLIGLKDYHDLTEILEAECATVLRTLEACPFLNADDQIKTATL